MKKVLHKAGSRGLAEHGWLISRHTFSFANYYDPERVHFGMLRVINDDIVQPGMGFGTHPHENMEIISIPLSGSLRHQDSMGNQHIISTGEVQVMSAGSGLTHSEYNNSEQDEVNFLQIWVYPQEKNIPPHYGQKRFDPAARKNRFQRLVGPEKSAETVWINQQAWLAMADLEAGTRLSYRQQRPGSGVYLFVVEGQLSAAGLLLARRDGLGLTGEEISIAAEIAAQLLVIEIPMASAI